MHLPSAWYCSWKRCRLSRALRLQFLVWVQPRRAKSFICPGSVATTIIWNALNKHHLVTAFYVLHRRSTQPDRPTIFCQSWLNGITRGGLDWHLPLSSILILHDTSSRYVWGNQGHAPFVSSRLVLSSPLFWLPRFIATSFQPLLHAFDAGLSNCISV